MDNDTTKTVPSAVLGEYLSDVQTIRTYAWNGVGVVRKTSPLRWNLREWFGNDVAERYTLDLYRLVEASVKAAKVEKPKRAKRQRTDARNNDRKLRAEMFTWRNERNRVNRGLRRIAADAGVSEASVRRALRLWEGDGQITRKRYARGRTQSIILHLEHPAWSEVKASHPSSV
jgi:hypothetical protein